MTKRSKKYFITRKIARWYSSILADMLIGMDVCKVALLSMDCGENIKVTQNPDNENILDVEWTLKSTSERVSSIHGAFKFQP